MNFWFESKFEVNKCSNFEFVKSIIFHYIEENYDNIF